MGPEGMAEVNKLVRSGVWWKSSIPNFFSLILEFSRVDRVSASVTKVARSGLGPFLAIEMLSKIFDLRTWNLGVSSSLDSGNDSWKVITLSSLPFRSSSSHRQVEQLSPIT